MNPMITFSLAILLLLISACEKFVQNIDPPVGGVPGEELNIPSQIPILSTGVKQRFTTIASNLTLLAGGLSDEMSFDDNIETATYDTYREIDKGNIRLNNISVEIVFNNLGELRFLADDLLRRIKVIEKKFAPLDSLSTREALFTGHFYGAIARYYMAAYFGKDPTVGGGVIDGGPFIKSNAMYDSAIVKFKTALNYHANDYNRTVVNSLIARCYLYQDPANMNAVETYAQKGINRYIPAQDRYLANYANYGNGTSNTWHSQAYYWNSGRLQWVVNSSYYYKHMLIKPGELNWPEVNRFTAYDAKLPIKSAPGKKDSLIYIIQHKYENSYNPHQLISFQENELMLAEAAFFKNDSTKVRIHINKARNSYPQLYIDIAKLGPLPASTAIKKQLIMEERNKSLFTTGARLIDQRRFKQFHIPGGWQYLPIPLSERNGNPNF